MIPRPVSRGRAGPMLLIPFVFALVPHAAAAQSVPLKSSAALGGVSVSSIVINSPVRSGGSATGTVTVAGKSDPSSSVTVSLTANGPLSIPASVIVGPRQVSHSFQVAAGVVDAPQTVTVTARVGSQTATTTVTVLPATIGSFACMPTSATTGEPVTCKVCVAGTPASGRTVDVSASAQYLAPTTPTSVLPTSRTSCISVGYKVIGTPGGYMGSPSPIVARYLGTVDTARVILR